MKRKARLLIVMVCLLLLVHTSTIFANEKNYVFDQYDLLNDSEEEVLEKKFAEIYNTYGFEAVLLISEDVYVDEKSYAADFMRENEIGYGDEMDGMCIFHQPNSRIIAIVFRGQYQDDFSVEIQDLMLDSCTLELKKDNMSGAYLSVLEDLECGLERISNGKSIRPMDIDGSGIFEYALKWLGLSFLIMAIPVMILVLVQMAKMKTKVPQKNADFYAPEEAFDLQMCRDIYLRTDVKRTKIEKESGGSGNGGSFKSGGESFSGSSRKY